MDHTSGIPDAPGEVKDGSSGCSHSMGDIADVINVQADDETQKDKLDGHNPAAVPFPAGQVIDANANESTRHKGNGTSGEGEASYDISNDDDSVSLTQANDVTDLDSSDPSKSCSIPSGVATISSATSNGDNNTSIVRKHGVHVHHPINEEKLEQPLNQLLNDAGQFSYVALCSVNLGLLFEDEWNRLVKQTYVYDTISSVTFFREH